MDLVTDVVGAQISNYSEIPMSSIKLLDEVRSLCEKNYCGSYGRNWACPPAIESLEDIREKFLKYHNFMVLYEIYEMEDSYDFEGMTNAIKDFQDKLLKVKNELRGKVDFEIFGVGGCTLCKSCTYEEGEPCRRPKDKIISLEASGIEVMSLMKENGLKYNNGPNTVTYMGGILY